MNFVIVSNMHAKSQVYALSAAISQMTKFMYYMIMGGNGKKNKRMEGTFNQ